MRIETKKLKEALIVLNNINKRPLSTFSMMAGNGSLKLWTKDSTASAAAQIDCEGILPIVTLPLKETLKLVRSIASEIVEYRNSAFYTPHGQYSVNEIDDHDSDLDFNGPIMLEPKTFDHIELARKIKSVLVASGVNSKSIRNYGSVVHFDTDRIVGTDGFRLSMADIDTGSLSGISLSILPLLAVSKIKAEKSTWMLTEDKSLLHIEIGPYKLALRTSALKFPRYHNVLPIFSNDIELPVFKNQLKALLQTTDKSQAITIEASYGTMRISTKTSSHCIDYQGQGVLKPTMINANFLLDTFKQTKEKSFSLQWSSKDDQPLQVGFKEFQTIIVPIKKVI